MKTRYKPFLLLSLLAATVPLLSGCGGGGHSSSSSSLSSTPTTVGSHAKGNLTLSIKWPNTANTHTGSVRPKEIPADTQSISIEVLQAGTVIKTGTIDKSNGITSEKDGSLNGKLSFSEIPAGDVTVQGRAYSSSGSTGTLLASAEQDTTIQVPGDNTVPLTLSLVPPPVDNEQYVLAGAIAPDPDNPSLTRITLSALINRADGTPVTGLTKDNFVVLEDGIRHQPLQVGPVSGTSSKADIAFAIDTTGSMDNEIAGVKNSVINFAQSLKDSGIDVRLAGDQFGDEIRGVFDFTSDPGAFQNWVKTLGAGGGGDTPENSLDAITTLSDTLTWRPDAQHIIIVITDAPSHQAGDGTDFTTQTGDSVVKHLAGSFVVDAISRGSAASSLVAHTPQNSGQSFPPNFSSHLRPRDSGAYVDVQAVANGTGGSWILLPDNGDVDLTKLPLGKAILNGYIISYPAKRTNTDHQIRIVVSIGGSYVADQNLTGHY